MMCYYMTRCTVPLLLTPSAPSTVARGDVGASSAYMGSRVPPRVLSSALSLNCGRGRATIGIHMGGDGRVSGRIERVE